jgi:hypothetical protein
MKATKKSKVLLTLALGAAMAVSVGVMQIDGDNVSVSADITVDSTTKIASEGFVMKDGASVRYKDNDGDKVSDEAGIRWTTEVSNEFVNYLETTYEGAIVEYRTLITAVNLPNRAEEVTVSDLTVENAEALKCNDTKGTLAKGKYYGSVLYKDDTVEGWADLDDAELRVIYETELVARSYVKVTKADNSVEYIYAQTGDTARSMRAVANAALMQGEDDLLNEYVGTATTQEERAGLYNPETDNGNVALELNELSDGTYVAYVGAKRVGEVTVENNATTVSVNGVADGEQTVSLFDTNADVYRAPFIKATKVIDEASDLAMFNLNNAYDETPTVKFDGYYILGNDIDASAYEHISIGWAEKGENKAVGLTGTFNGDGYKISHLTFKGNASQLNGAATTTDNYKKMDYSLFGIVCGGTIKNVGFVNVSYNVTSGINQADRATLASQLRGATLENVYIQLSGLGYGQGSYYSPVSGVAGTIDETTVMKNCIVDVPDDGTVQAYSNKILAGFGALSADGGLESNNAYSNVTGRNWTNVYVVSPLALSHERSTDKVHWEWYGANLNKTESDYATQFVNYENVTQYLSHDDMVAANINYEELGFTADKGWKIVDGYVPTWKGVALAKTVNYTVNLDDEKKQLSEDDLYALFGDKNATLVSASTSDSTYGISYTGSALSVTGADAAWNGETFTAVFSDGDWNVTATVRLCTEVITTAEELGVFCLDNTDYATLNSASSKTPTKTITGYYVLDKDIDASTYAMPTHGHISTTYDTTKMPNVGFQGTFDGCGYTISGITFGTEQQALVDDATSKTYRTLWNLNAYSLFGIIGKNATIKNFALTDVQFMLKNGKATMYTAQCAGLATWINGATIENVYVSIKGIVDYYDANSTAKNVKNNTCVSALAYGIYSATTMNNVVVDYTYSGDDVLSVTKSSVFVQRKCANSDASITEISSWKNVYVISEKKIVIQTGSNLLWAANDTNYVAGTSTGALVTGLYQYADMDTWKQAQESDSTKNDFTSFKDVACWDLTTGVPVWGN